MENTREFNFDEISIYHICKDLLKNIWVIILAAATMWLGIAGAYKLAYVPEYTAEATVAVGAKGSDSGAYASLSLTTQMAGVFSEVFQSEVLLNKIREELGEEIQGTLSSSVITETNLMVLRATARNPREAYLLLQSAMKNYSTVSDYLFSNAVLRVLKEPSVPSMPSNIIHVERTKKLGVIAGGGLAAIIIALFSVFRFTVKTKVSARRNLDGKILGNIPFEHKYHTLKELIHRKKKSILISQTTVSMPFVEAYRKFATRLESYMRRHEVEILTVASVGENEGKSSVAVNTALALAEKGRKVLLIDLDLKKPAQMMILNDKETTKPMLKDYLQGKASMSDILNYDEKTHLYSIYQGKGVANSGKWLYSEKIQDLLRVYKEKMDYIIIDSSPMGHSSDAEILMKLADAVILVVRQDWCDIRAINEAVDSILQSKVKFAGFVLNAFHKDLTAQGNSSYYYYRYGEKGRKRRESDERA